MCNENTRRRRKRGTEEIFEKKKKMTEIFLKFMSDAKQQIQEDQQTSNRTNDHNTPSPRPQIIPRYIIFRLQKTKIKKKF